MRGQPFFRLSKLCFLEWVASIYMIVHGFKQKDGMLQLVGLAVFLFSPVVNELLENLFSCCQSFDPEQVKAKFG